LPPAAATEKPYITFAFGSAGGIMAVVALTKKGLCAKCGACVSFCPFGVLELGPRGPELKGKCVGCGICYNVCPRFKPDLEALERYAFGRARKSDEEFGVLRSIALARSKDEEVLAVCQDGGVVTTLVKHLLESGQARLAVLSGVSEEVPWLPEARIVLSGQEALECAGSRYTYDTGMMSKLGVAAFLALLEGTRAAFVGLPCQVQAVRKIQVLPVEELGWRDAIGPIIGLFCTETFDYEGLMAFLREKIGLVPEEVVKMNIKKGRLYFYPKEGEPKGVKIKELEALAREGCKACTDFSAELADISVGSLGLEGWNVVIIRSELGEEVFNAAVEAGLLETKPVEEEPKVIEILKRLTELKRKRGESGES